MSSTVSESGGAPTSPPPPDAECGWVKFGASVQLAEVFNVLEDINAMITTVLTFHRVEVTVEYYSEGNVLHRYNSDTGAFEYKRTWKCDEGHVRLDGEPARGAVDWQTVRDPDPIVLLDRTKTVTATIGAPEPIVSPLPQAGVPVNFGIWFAVAEAGPYEAWAGFNDRVWARRTATLESTSFDPGNGDAPVVCVGAGTPIPDPATPSVEPGPCGYVYTQYSDVTSDITVTVTSRWRVDWELSNGRSGRDPDLSTTTSFPYDVYEIQTVGTG